MRARLYAEGVVSPREGYALDVLSRGGGGGGRGDGGAVVQLGFGVQSPIP